MAEEFLVHEIATFKSFIVQKCKFKKRYSAEVFCNFKKKKNRKKEKAKMQNENAKLPFSRPNKSPELKT